MSHKTWMQHSDAIRNAPLRYICLPATHDTGTYRFKKRLVKKDLGLFASVFNVIEEYFVEPLAKLHIPGWGPRETLDWVIDHVYDVITGLARATDKTVREQLEGGIRSMDFRLFYDPDEDRFYTWHGFVAVEFDEILDELATFLRETSSGSGGEIVYITISHCAVNTGDFPHSELAALVQDKLGKYLYAPSWEPTYAKQSTGSRTALNNHVFDRTYAQIVSTAPPGSSSDDKKAGSRVIVVYPDVYPSDDDGTPPEEAYADLYWPESYCPANENRDWDPVGGGIVGRYANKSDVDAVVSYQHKQLHDAVKDDRPFALFLTLTPSPEDCVRVVVTKLLEPVIGLLPIIGVIPGGREILEEFIALIEESGHVELPWTTLKQLASHVDRDLPSIVDKMVDEVGRAPNRLSTIFVDFYETTRLVELAQNLCGIREWQWAGGNPLAFETLPPGAKVTADGSGAMAEVAGTLMTVYPNDESLYFAQAYRFQHESVWTYRGPVQSTAGVDATTQHPPALVGHDGTGYLAFVGKDGNLYLATYGENRWSAFTPITVQDGGATRALRSGAGPALAVYGPEDAPQLYLAYRGTGSDEALYLATCDVATLAWSGGSKISKMPGKIDPTSRETPFLASYRDALYLFFIAGDEQRIYAATYDGTQWLRNTTIYQLSDKKIDPRSRKAPSAAVVNGVMTLCYRGASDDNERLYAAWYDGKKWSGDERIADLSQAVFVDPKSPYRPALASFQRGLCLVYQNGRTLDGAGFFDNPCLWQGDRKIVSPDEGSSCKSAVAPALATFDVGKGVDAYYNDEGTLYYAACAGDPAFVEWSGGFPLLAESGGPVYVDTGTSPGAVVVDNETLLAWSTEGVLYWGTSAYGTTPPAFTSDVAPIEVDGVRLQTSNSPSLVLFEGKVYLVYALFDPTGGANVPRLAIYDPDSRTWSGGDPIWPGYGVGGTLSVAVHEGRIYLMFVENGGIQLSTYDGRAWTYPEYLATITQRDGYYFGPLASAAPGMASFRGELWFVYPAYGGPDKLRVSWLSANGRWYGDLELKQVAPISPSSTLGPAAAIVDDALVLAYRSGDPASTNLYWASFAPVSFAGADDAERRDGAAAEPVSEAVLEAAQ